MIIKVREPFFNENILETTTMAFIKIEPDRVKVDIETTSYLGDIINTTVHLEVGLPSKSLRFTGRFIVEAVKTDTTKWGDETVGLFTYSLQSVGGVNGFIPREADFYTYELVLTTTL